MEFESIIGNKETRNYLLNSVLKNTVSQSYLFNGSEGIGKNLIAKEFAKRLLCVGEKNDECKCKSCQSFDGSNHPDFVVINEDETTIKIEQIRELTSKVIEQPIISGKKVYIINHADKMTVEAQNCLLKTLEEPPRFAVIILITSNLNLILPTIKSRCMKINFLNISNEELKKYAIEKIGYSQVTDNLLKSFNGSIGKAVLQKENQEKFQQVENIISYLSTKDIIDVLNESKVIYDKENIYKLLEYMIVCLYSKKEENIKYLDCIELVNNCIERLKRNCNFDMTIDSMIFDMNRCFKEG